MQATPPAARRQDEAARNRPPPARREQQAPSREPEILAERRIGAARDSNPPPVISAPVAPPPVMPLPAMPKAETPWPEPDSIEGEIVAALNAEPAPPQAEAAQAAKTEPRDIGLLKAPAKAATTLGDLAERLEEALAREVRSAKDREKDPAMDFDFGPFEFESRGGEERPPEAPNTEPEPAAASPAVAEDSGSHPAATAEPGSEPGPSEPATARVQAELREAPGPASDAPRESRVEAERMPAERQDQVPVINLSERRRDAVDPLEDEMARLLGELAGDTNSRR